MTIHEIRSNEAMNHIITVLGDRIILVRTEFVYPPIPDRRWDWAAVTDNYEPGEPIGWGYTEEDAIHDLKTQIEDQDD